MNSRSRGLKNCPVFLMRNHPNLKRECPRMSPVTGIGPHSGYTARLRMKRQAKAATMVEFRKAKANTGITA